MSLALAIDPVSQRGRGRLVDDAQDIEASQTSGEPRGLALAIVEIRGDRDYRFFHLRFEFSFGRHAKLTQNHGRNINRTENSFTDANVRLQDPARSLSRFDFVRHLRGEVANLVPTFTYQSFKGKCGTLGRLITPFASRKSRDL